MDGEISFCELRKKEVVNAADGTRLGHIVDMIISVETKTALGIVAPVKRSGFFAKEQNLFIPLSCIVKIGADVILIDMAPGGNAGTSRSGRSAVRGQLQIVRLTSGRALPRLTTAGQNATMLCGRRIPMKCNKCGCLESKVIDSRVSGDGTSIRRRRECLGCGRRFTTYEVVESVPVLVVKNDGTRQTFDVEKIRRGIIKACEKRPVTAEQVNTAVSNVEKQIYNTLLQEITSKQIGELVMLELKNLDEVAYVRFASVYRDFRDVTTFVEFIGDLERIIKEEKDSAKE